MRGDDFAGRQGEEYLARFSGDDAYVMTMTLHRRGLDLINGEPELFSFQTQEGIARHDRRCPSCGCRLWSESSVVPEVIALRPGTLDDKSWLYPIAHIYTASAQPWVEIPEDVLQFERDADDILELIRIWKARG